MVIGFVSRLLVGIFVSGALLIIFLILFNYRIYKYLIDYFARLFVYFIDFLHSDIHNGLCYEISYHGLYISSNISYFRKLRGFHLYEGSIYEFCKPSCNLRLSAACRAFHEYILRRYFILHLFAQLCPSVSISHGNSHLLFSIILTYYVFIESCYCLLRCQNSCVFCIQAHCILLNECLKLIITMLIYIK